jgi:natural product biosynthesis luciferase-like monooxygenase protein
MDDRFSAARVLPTRSGTVVDFSLFYFANDSTTQDRGNRYELLLDGARFADRNGFAAVWTPERHFHPFGGLYPNPSVIGAAIAVVTERIGIRAGSVNAPLHHPLRVAEEWSVVDNLSGGRAGVSFASGWHSVDFALRPESFTDRKRLMTETVDTVRRLWAGESVPVLTGNGEQVDVRVFPPPVQTDLPVWLTCAGNAETFRTAGRMRAGVLTHLLGQDLDDLAEKIAHYRRAAEAAGGGPGQVTVMLHTLIGADTESVRETVRGPFSDYLRSSFGLIARSVLGPEFTSMDDLHADDIDFLVDRSFDRYFTTSGLFGTVEDASVIVDKLRAIGVDEIACLIDFGVDNGVVLSGLEYLNALRKRFTA